MSKLKLGVCVVLFASVCFPRQLPATDKSISPADLRARVEYLASEALLGRQTGGEGERLATNYVAEGFKAFGLKAAGVESYFQPFEFTAGISLGAGNQLSVEGSGCPLADLKVDTDFRPLAFSKNGAQGPSDVVFVGYGIMAPPTESLPAYNSYLGAELSGKWALAFRFLPEQIDANFRKHLLPYAELRRKAAHARSLGAAGIIFVRGPNSSFNHELVELSVLPGLGETSITTISITDRIAGCLLDSKVGMLKSLQDLLDTGAIMPPETLAKTRISAKVDLIQKKGKSRNVLGVLEAPNKDANYLVVGAHVDHLGPAEARFSPNSSYFPGADDDASGVAAVMEIAEWLSSPVVRGGFNPKKHVLFATWTGEEMGRLGSTYFVNSLGRPPYPTFSSYFNLDMVGRPVETFFVQGVGSSSVWPTLLTEAVQPGVGLKLELQTDPYLPTDSTSFYLNGVPILNAFTGLHDDYHTTRDTADKINYEGLRQVTQFMADVVQRVAEDPVVPDFIQFSSPGGSTQPRVYLGTIPDFSQTVKGVLLAGVRPQGPADRAGLRKGDVIVEIGGMRVENIYDYNDALVLLHVGEPTPVQIIRGSASLTLTVTPEASPS